MGTYSTFQVFPRCLLGVSSSLNFYSNCVSYSTESSGSPSLFWLQKWQNYCDKACSHFEWHMTLNMWVIPAYLFKVHFEYLLTEWLDTMDKIWLAIILFYCSIKWSYWTCTFSPKFLQFVEKPPNKSDQYHDQNN